MAKWSDLIAVLSFCLFFTLLSAAYAGWEQVETLQNQAIERGYALHCPITGDYAWKGECDD